MRKKSTNKRKVITAAALAAMLLVAAMPAALAGQDDNIVFTDDALKQALVGAGVDTSGDGEITEGEMAAYTEALSLVGLGITDPAGLQFATGTPSIDLSANAISDIAVLSGLVQLTTLDVSNNYLDTTPESDDMAVITVLINAGCAVTYEPQSVPVTGVSLEPAAISGMCPGDTYALTVTVSPEDATDKSVSWTSSDTGVATVSNGIITAVGAGDAIITVTTNMGGYIAQCTVSVKSFTLSSSIYTVGGGYIRDVAKLTSPGQFRYNLDNDPDDVIIYNSDGSVYTGTRVATGMDARLVIGGTQRDEATIIVDGDTNGDGMISISDYTTARLHILDLMPLEGDFLTACDVSGDGSVTISDYTLMRLDILGLLPVGSTLPDLPEVSDPNIRAFLDMALAQQGKPYVWSEEGPDSFDCSGYIYYCLNQVGYSVWRATANTYSQWEDWLYVDRDDLQPGDLMFYWSDSIPGRIGHIGIYLGNGYHIHASSSYGCIIICKVDGWYDEMLSHGRRVWY